MPECDLHIHSIRSTCGFHTLLEIVSIVRDRGLKAFALTDHGPVHGTPFPHFPVMLSRMPSLVEGIRVFKGIEATILNEEGELDKPVFENGSYEVVLAALHDYGEFSAPGGTERNTRAVVNAMRRHPEIRVLAHPFYGKFPLDLDAVTDVALETGTALEVNNSYLLTGKADTEALSILLEYAGEKGTMLCVNSDGHMFNEMGNFDRALAFLERYGVENLTIVNTTLESTLEFLGLEE